METLNNLKKLIYDIFYSINSKYRIHIPFVISISTIIFSFFVDSFKFWRQTIGYNLVGLLFFVTTFSIINIFELKKQKQFPRKILKYIENGFFIIFFLFVHLLFTARTGLFQTKGSYNLSEGFIPFIKITLFF